MTTVAVYERRVIYSGHPSSLAQVRHFGDEALAMSLTCRIVVEGLEPLRTPDQNAKLHCICADIAAQRQWAGQWIGLEDWKRLLVDAWTRETQRMATRFVPSLDGSGVVALGVQTRKMSVRQMAELIQFAIAYADDNGITLTEKNDDGTH